MKSPDLLPQKRFFRPDELATILCLSRRTVYRMITDGRLQAVKWGGGPWRIPQEAVTALFPPDLAFG